MWGGMKRRAFLIRTAAVGAAVAGGLWLKDHVLWRKPRLSFGTDGSSGWSPLAVTETATPTVRVDMAGRSFVALIDSGAQYSVIDRALVAELDLTDVFDMPLVAYGVGGRPQVGRGTTLAITVGDLRIEGLRAAILDLGPLAREEGLGAPLILGQDVLGEAVLDIDMKGRRVRLTRPDAHVPPPSVRPLAVRRSGTALTTEIVVEGTPLTAVIDTGSSALAALSRSAAEAAGLLDGRPERSGSSIVLGGLTSARVVEARRVVVGDEVWNGTEVHVYADAPLPNYPRALLGMAAFADRQVVLDLGRGRLHLSSEMDLMVGPPA
ncbi:putative aspartyl protease [Brevundimonas faecalis]|uniref:Aspartyl protease n=2 Tax=Brevundimonas faecalis TaxID=947378 RepID=A0ABV2RER2_9CAUL